MRRCNALLTAVMMGLLLIHAVAGIFEMIGWISGGNPVLSILSWALVFFVCIHMVIGCRLTWDTLVAIRQAKASYFKENKRFWACRISGLALVVLILFHVLLFLTKDTGVIRLAYFGPLQLATQLLMVLCLGTHVLINVRPAIIAFGCRSLKPYALDILIIISVLLLVTGLAFGVYYLRWIRI